MVIKLIRKFKSKKKIKSSKLIKLIITILIIIFLCKYLNIKFNFKFYNKFIKYIINDNNYASQDNIYKNIIDDNTHEIINNPTNLLATNFHYKKEEKDLKVVSNEKKEDNNPLVYLYNSHQKESYSMEYMEDYNINPTVLTASYMIQERLNKMGINTIVEENSISDYLKENDMKYYQSYEASRHYLLNTMEKYDSIKLYLDIHRDAISHEYSTVNINDLECAKIMFVVGLEHDNYLTNRENAKHLNDMIKSKYPTLTRGVIEKEGKNVNGIYNQDLGSNIMLIEIGGNYNNINEVLNTIDLITPIIGEYINEKR